MKKLNLSQIGNLEYQHEPRFAYPHRVIQPTSELALKLYRVGSEREPIFQLQEEQAIQFIEREATNKRISPEIGMGFSILTKDMLNVVRWGKEHPIVMMNQIYEFNPDKISATAKRLDVNECGSFCIWEAGIIPHEREAWMKYLNSYKTDEDKENYLTNFCSGWL